MRVNCYKTNSFGWIYLLPSVEYRHKYWFLWQVTFSWLKWSRTIEITIKQKEYE